MARAGAGLLLALLVACGGDGAERAPGEPVNLLMVVLDTTRADHLSCYGRAGATTPELDQLAARGVRFESAWAQSSLTPVSAASFLSGAWPYRTGIRSLFVVGGETLSPEVPSLFERLRESGRATAGFVSAKPMGAHYGLSRGFDLYDDDLGETAARYGLTQFADAPQRPGDETVDRALDWLAANAGEPFALMVHLFDAHDPSFVPPREFLTERLSFPVPEGLGRLNPRSGWPEVYRPEPARVELYDAELSFLSAQVQRLLEGLERAGATRDTVVCVLADHGEAFGEHDFWTHGLLYQEQLRVPLVLAGPGIARGAVVPDTLRLVDLAPTLLEHFGLDASGCDGVSFVARLDGSHGDDDPPELYAEVHHAAEDRLRRDTEMYSLALGPWKYIHRPVNGAHELYDLAHDPGELANLYRADHPMVKILQVRLIGRGAVDGAVPDLEGIPEQELARLRELGYL